MVLQMTLEDLNFKESPEAYLKRFAPYSYEGQVLNINGFEGFTAKANRSGRITRMAVLFKGDQVFGIGLCIVIRDKNLGLAHVVNG